MRSADGAPKIVIADAANQPLLQAAHSSLPMVERWYGIGTISGLFAPYADLLSGADQRRWRRRIPTRTLGSS